ncbi:hypothetical protein R6Q57_013168 [Mikania cordata]
MKVNLIGSKSERFMMYPRFLQLIFDERYSGLQKGVVTRDLKLLSESTFPLMMQNREKFGQFAEIKDINAAEEPMIPNVFVEEEHDVETVSSKFYDEDVYVVKLPKYEDVLTVEGTNMDFDFEIESHEVENDIPEQMNLLTTENLVALLEHVKRSAGYPPSATSFTKLEPPLDVAADLLQSRVFELEEDSLSHTLPIEELKTDSEIKEKKIKDL